MPASHAKGERAERSHRAPADGPKLGGGYFCPLLPSLRSPGGPSAVRRPCGFVCGKPAGGGVHAIHKVAARECSSSTPRELRSFSTAARLRGFSETSRNVRARGGGGEEYGRRDAEARARRRSSVLRALQDPGPTYVKCSSVSATQRLRRGGGRHFRLPRYVYFASFTGKRQLFREHKHERWLLLDKMARERSRACSFKTSLSRGLDDIHNRQKRPGFVPKDPKDLATLLALRPASAPSSREVESTGDRART